MGYGLLRIGRPDKPPEYLDCDERGKVCQGNKNGDADKVHGFGNRAVKGDENIHADNNQRRKNERKGTREDCQQAVPNTFSFEVEPEHIQELQGIEQPGYAEDMPDAGEVSISLCNRFFY
jgi:hypothetical protein